MITSCNSEQLAETAKQERSADKTEKEIKHQHLNIDGKYHDALSIDETITVPQNA